MRPRIVASAMLTVGLVLVASPGLVGSISPPRPSQPELANVQTLPLPGAADATLDPSGRSANALSPSATFAEPPVPGPARSPVALARGDGPVAGSEPRPTPTPGPTRPPTSGATTPPGAHIVKGYATWYDNGTTAMRLRRGTKVRICGKAACIDRTITDWGPAAWTGRIADLTPSDFRRVCGCGTGSGVTFVTVYVY